MSKVAASSCIHDRLSSISKSSTNCASTTFRCNIFEKVVQLGGHQYHEAHWPSSLPIIAAWECHTLDCVYLLVLHILNQPLLPFPLVLSTVHIFSCVTCWVHPLGIS